MISQRELTQDNVKVFGFHDAAKILRKRKVPFTIAYWMIFGKAPRSLPNPPCNAKDMKQASCLRNAQAFVAVSLF